MGHLVKFISLDFAYQMECLKALCLAVACISHYPIYHSLLGEFIHSWNMLAVYQIRKQWSPARCSARCPVLKDPPTLSTVFRGLFPFHQHRLYFTVFFWPRKESQRAKFWCSTSISFAFFHYIFRLWFYKYIFPTKNISLDLCLHKLAARKGSAYMLLWHLPFTITMQFLQGLP